ncbi:MAG: ankyrin repeat domain-containing protein [Rhabdochlamydiaceae bacterium]|nr:ankyrin repeat domain-containing protein [Rhabdochlamydiaceae bacterium]
MSVEFKSIQNSNIEDVCPICQDKMEGGLVSHNVDKVQHIFHEGCLTPWLKNHPSCPVCRIKVSSINGVSLAPQMDFMSWSNAIHRAVRGDNINKALDLIAITSVFSGPEDRREYAISNAITSGSLEMICALLASGPISDIGRGRAIKLAAREGSFDTVRALLESGPISENDHREIVQIATERGHRRIVSLFAEQGLSICFKLCSAALITAVGLCACMFG